MSQLGKCTRKMYDYNEHNEAVGKRMDGPYDPERATSNYSSIRRSGNVQSKRTTEAAMQSYYMYGGAYENKDACMSQQYRPGRQNVVDLETQLMNPRMGRHINVHSVRSVAEPSVECPCNRK